MDGPEYCFILQAKHIDKLIHFLNSQILPYAISDDGDYIDDIPEKMQKIKNFQVNRHLTDFRIPIVHPLSSQHILSLIFGFDSVMSQHGFLYFSLNTTWSSGRFEKYTEWRKQINLFCQNIDFLYGYAWTHMSHIHTNSLDLYTQLFQQILLPHGTMFIPIDILKEINLFENILSDASKFHYFMVYEKFIWVEFF